MSVDTLYKYRSLDRADDLRSCTIRLTPPNAFNDPFEALPAVDGAWDSDALRFLETETHRLAAADGRALNAHAVRQQFRLMNVLASRNGSTWTHKAASETFGVVSFSARYDEPIMWGHYADSHRGFVIGFDARHSWFDRREREDDPINHVAQVEYSTQRPAVTLSQFYTNEIEAAAALFLTKYLGWTYESEQRLILRLEAADQTTADGIALLRFPPELVIEVIYGCRMDYAGRAAIDEILDDPRYRHVRRYNAVLDNKTYHVHRQSVEGRIWQPFPLSIRRPLTERRLDD